MSTPYVPSALQSELVNDPLNLGYAPLLAAGADGPMAAILNARTGDGAGSVPNDKIPTSEFLACIDGSEIGNLTNLEQGQLELYTGSGDGLFDIGNSEIQEWLNGLFTEGRFPLSRTKLQAKYTRTGSRAEVLFGNNFHITIEQVNEARNLQ